MRQKLGYDQLNWSIPDVDDRKTEPSYEAVCMMCAERFGEDDARWAGVTQSPCCGRCGGRILIERSDVKRDS